MVPLAFFLAVACLVFTSDASIVKRQTDDCPDECKNVPMEISFIVDGSTSIWRGNFSLGLWFVQDFVDQFDIGQDKVRVSLVTYGDKVNEEDAIGFNDFSSKAELNQAIDNIPYRGGPKTETGMAIDWFMEHQLPSARPNVRHVVIVLTDGNSQRPDVTAAAASRALDSGLDVFAIGVGQKVSEQELHNIASDGRHVFMVGSYGMLNDIMSRLAYEACDVGPTPSCQFDPVDIALVIDSSRSIGRDDFALGQRFIKDFLEQFVINPSSVRVAAIMYGDRVYGEHAIPFDMYRNNKDTEDAILALPWMDGGSTQTGLGIDYMIDNFLPHARPHAAHLGIVITDGQSQMPKVTKAAAQRARAAGLNMIAVGIGRVSDNLDQQELEDIAGGPEYVVLAENYKVLNTIKAPLTDKTCVEIDRLIQEQRQVFYQPQ